MNEDPWSLLVETLSGTVRKTPEAWPARRIHRMQDDQPPPMRRRTASALGDPQRANMRARTPP
ncbi:MAG: hypothetical protein JSR59_10490 [Proteobacteria bacterium]|nr:hypothetical protein [Pseudomonadota bacterium]